MFLTAAAAATQKTHHITNTTIFIGGQGERDI